MRNCGHALPRSTKCGPQCFRNSDGNLRSKNLAARPEIRLLSLERDAIPLMQPIHRLPIERCLSRSVSRRIGPTPSKTLGNIVPGAFTPVLAKHTKHLSLVDILSVGVDRMQRNFEPMRKQVEVWKGTRLLDDTAKLVIYRAFVEGKLDAPTRLARRVHDAYFDPRVEEFAPRTMWSLSNAFTSAFKDLDPIPQFRTTAKLASFLELATASSN